MRKRLQKSTALAVCLACVPATAVICAAEKDNASTTANYNKNDAALTKSFDIRVNRAEGQIAANPVAESFNLAKTSAADPLRLDQALAGNVKAKFGAQDKTDLTAESFAKSATPTSTTKNLANPNQVPAGLAAEAITGDVERDRQDTDTDNRFDAAPGVRSAAETR